MGTIILLIFKTNQRKTADRSELCGKTADKKKTRGLFRKGENKGIIQKRGKQGDYSEKGKTSELVS
ncbi:TPA: hypothetical protein ACFN7K_000877 [Neisseria meningitidis]